MNILAKLSRAYFRYKHKILDDFETFDYYKGLQTPADLQKKLALDNYQWSGEYYLCDWNKTPNEALSVKNINCGDFMTLYFYLYELRNINYEGYYMENWDNIFDPQYHYISLFNLDGQMYLQSNNVIQPVINKEVVLDFYKARGYNIISKI